MPSSIQAENAARCMEHLCEHWFHGYTQGEGRWGDGEGYCEVEGVDGSTLYVVQGDRDCSAGDVSAYEAAGISCGGATWTGNALDCMLASGNFRAHRMSDGYNCDDGYIAKRSDAYLAHIPGYFEHMAMCVSQVPDLLAEFSGNEFGGIVGGVVGDQTGWESHITGFYGGWEWCLECIVDDDGGSYEPPADDVRYMVSIDASGKSWLPEMVGAYDRGGSGDDYAGIIGQPIYWFACDAGKYRVFTESAGWLPWVDRYDIGDLEYGCAGDGSAILGVEVEDGGTAYRVHVDYMMADGGTWYADMRGQNDTGGSSDHFAGDLANRIDGIAMRRL